MAAPTYSGISSLDTGTSNASTLGASAPSSQVEQTTGIQMNPANTTTTYGRGWTHSPALDMSAPGTIITYLVGRTGGSSGTFFQAYPAGWKMAIASSASDYKKYLLLNTNNATFFNSTSKPGNNATTGALFHCALAPTTHLETDTVGSINFAAINRVEIHGDGNGSTSVSFQAIQLFWASAVLASLGEVGNPIIISALASYARTTAGYTEGNRSQYAFPDIASSRIFQIPFSVRIGDGTNAFYCDDQTGFSLIFPQGNTSSDFSANQHHLQIPPDWHRFRISPVNGSTCYLRGSISRSDGWHFVVDSYTGTFTNNLQLTLNNCTSITLRSGINFSGSISGGTGELTANGASLSNLTIRNTTGTGYAFNTTDTTSSLSFVSNTVGGRITAAGDYSNVNASFSGNTTAINITSAVTSGAIDLSNCTFSGNTTDIYWAGTSGSITVTVGQTGLTTSTAGGTINLVEPTDTLRLYGIPNVTNAILYVKNLTTSVVTYPTLSGGEATITVNPADDYEVRADAPGYLASPFVTLSGATPEYQFNLENFRTLYESGTNRSSAIAFNYSTLEVTINDDMANYTFADVFRTLEDYLSTEDGILFPNPPYPVVLPDRNVLWFPYDSGTSTVNPVKIMPDPTNTTDPALSDFEVYLEGATDPVFDLFDFTGASGRILRVRSSVAVATSTGGGEADWTTTERNQIRYRLGIDGTTATPSASPTLPVSVSAISNNAITAASIATDAVTEIQSGLATPQTVWEYSTRALTDKSGFSLTQAFPANFASLGINSSGHISRVTLTDALTTNNDKTGYSLTQSFPANFASLGINSSGHISRVTLTDALTANNDKTGYSLSVTPPTAQNIWEYSTRTLTSAGSTLTAEDVWTYATRSLTDKAGFSLSQSFPANFASLGINSSGHISRVTVTDSVTSGGGLDAAGVRAAVGLSSANLDTQLSGINTNIDDIPTNPLLTNDARLDNLDTAISTRSTFNPTTTGVIVTTNNDKSGYSLATAPPTASEVANAVWGYSGVIASNVLNQVVADISDLATTTTVNTGFANLTTLVNGIPTTTLTTTQDTRLGEMWQILGMNSSAPVTASPTARTSGTITQTIVDNGDGSKTMTRTA